ncbi:hypothetical protein BDV35DRAFT_336465 [Aspergillus flavus]|uniref:Uncharacterized protein n=1 Tax=Aspergillus flavus TaxID=5059 RepID=A0A5N6HGK0_ASPFL|nr:hypothetical protein BDV35DRAFT_336465 [Aspergillus flavus]
MVSYIVLIFLAPLLTTWLPKLNNHPVLPVSRQRCHTICSHNRKIPLSKDKPPNQICHPPAARPSFPGPGSVIGTIMLSVLSIKGRKKGRS